MKVIIMITRQCKSLLEEYLNYFSCVGIVGPRQSGKTTLMQSVTKDWSHYDLEKNDDYDIISADPDLFLRLNPEKTTIDEAQLMPELFSALRVAIDADRNKNGRFIITGSSSPELLKSISESLAGRIGIIELSPLALNELHGNRDDFYSLFTNPDSFRDVIDGLHEKTSTDEIINYWFRGGFPEPWIKDSKRFSDVWLEQYIQSYVYRDIARLFPGLNTQRFRQFTGMLAGLSGQVINYSEVARSLGVSQPTVRDYFSIANHTFLWRQILPYEKSVKKRITKHPKGYLRDSGLLHYLLRIGDVRQLLSHPCMGFSWESMVIEEFIRGLSNRGISHDYYYLRTAAGAEIDLILEGKFGTIPIEIKFNRKARHNKLRTLKDFVEQHNLPYGIVIDNGESVRWLTEKIVALPFSYCM